MKVLLERDALQAALGRVAKAAGDGKVIPILGHILLRAEGAGLTLVGSDVDIEARETIAAEVSQPGALCVPARILADVVGRSASGAQVALEQAEHKLVLKVGRARIALQTLPAEDFPEAVFGDEAGAADFTIEAATLANLFTRTEFAISREQTRYYLCGTYMHAIEVDGAQLCAVATDGHRLARVYIPAPAGAELLRGVIVPRETTAEITRLAKALPGECRVAINSRQIRVAFTGGTTLISKLVEGTFPDYERLIPTSHPIKAVLDREALFETLHRVSAVAGTRPIKLSLSAERIEIATQNPDAGEAAEEFEIDYSGNEIAIGFNPKYLRDSLLTLEGDQLRLSLDSPGSPAVFEPKTQDGTVILVMPIRI